MTDDPRTTHDRQPGIEISLSPEMIERVLSQWEKENPGKDAMIDMGEDEFSARMMAAILASARIMPDA